MNAPHSLEIEITPEGQIKSTVKGVAGPDCSKISAWLDDLGRVTLDQHTLDYNKAKDQHLKIYNR